MRIRFTETRVVQDGTGRTFEKDRAYDLSESSALHWLKRGVAVVEDEPTPVQKAAGASVPPPTNVPDAKPSPAQAQPKRRGCPRKSGDA